MAEAFFEKRGAEFVATELTRGPWDPTAQHAGPPAALLGREIERVQGAEGFQIGRITFEILRSVPIGPVRLRTEIVRPGRNVQLIEASLGNEEGDLMLARAWRLRTRDVDVPDEAMAPFDPPPSLRPATNSSSSRPARRSATTVRWRAGRLPAASSSPARPLCGCECGIRWSRARSQARCNAR